MKERPICSLRDLARARLDKLRAEPEEESERIKQLRAEGYFIAGTPSTGYVILPPEGD